jgi:hypothetical protein
MRAFSGRVFGVTCIAAIAILSLTAAASAAVTARTLLKTRLPVADLTNVPLGDALDFLRDVASVNIVVDWKTLQSVNITKDAQINLKLHDVTAGKVLSLILEQAGPGDLLTYVIDDNVIEITTRAAADAKLITVIYYVMDLLQPNDQFNYQITNINGGGAQVGNGSGTSSLQINNTSQGKTVEQKAQELIKLIETIIRPEIWRDNGGTASMEYWNGNLIVTAPRSVQEAIGGPVDQ